MLKALRRRGSPSVENAHFRCRVKDCGITSHSLIEHDIEHLTVQLMTVRWRMSAASRS
jgi:hypothetical protein